MKWASFGLATFIVIVIASTLGEEAAPTTAPGANATPAAVNNETSNELPAIAETSRIALEKALDEAFTKSGLPGVITGLWIPGSGSWIASRGVSDLKTKAPMTADLQAPIGSITKTFAITIGLQLVGEGRLRLEDTIERWYPQIPDASAITIKMLLNHSSGFPDISMLQLELRCANPKRVVSPDELIARGIKLPRAKFAPGKGSLYSSLNTIVLGRILEKITGESFAALLSERILKPLALHRTKLDTDGKLESTFLPRLHRFLPEHAAADRHVRVAPVLFCLRSARIDIVRLASVGYRAWRRVRPHTSTSADTHRRRAWYRGPT